MKQILLDVADWPIRLPRAHVPETARVSEHRMVRVRRYSNRKVSRRTCLDDLRNWLIREAA